MKILLTKILQVVFVVLEEKIKKKNDETQLPALKYSNQVLSRTPPPRPDSKS